MATIPLGLGAYKRSVAGEPEIQLVNRFVEKAITNLEEHVALLARPGTTSLATFAGGVQRRSFAREGLFNGDLFQVSGNNLWRYASDGTKTQITGVIYGTGQPYVTWMKGEGYEYMFIADGLLLQYYNGGTYATGTLTLTPSTPPDISTQKITIGGATYSWNNSVDTNAPDGTVSHPWLCKLGADDAGSLANMASMINYGGIPGVDFSTALPGPSTDYIATSTATTLVITLRSSFLTGSTFSTSVTGAHLAWGAATLTGGDTHALAQVVTPDGVAIKALASLAGFVLASVGNSRKFFFIQPGEVTIDPLDFAEKESNPDNILDMLTAGDQTLIMGDGSTESWYATGDLDAPFAPVKGLAYSRGIVEGTPVLVKDNIILVGNDQIVYSIGAGGVVPISDNGIAERIRTQLRREAGL